MRSKIRSDSNRMRRRRQFKKENMKDFFEFSKKVESIFGDAAKIKLGAPEFMRGKNCREVYTVARAAENFRKIADKRFANLKALVFSPHPDDESITAGLSLRLMAECGFSIKNIAVTLGSDKRRREARAQELSQACGFLGWDLQICGDGCGYDNVRPESRDSDPPQWRARVEEIAQIIRGENPSAIFAPHADDWNKTHIGVSLLVSDALELLNGCWRGLVIDTEYWGAMKDPNMLVEIPVAVLAAQMTAVSFHAGEVERNAYHLRLPSWASDNVRRGGEIVGGQGGNVPNFAFGELYRVREFRDGAFQKKFAAKFLSQKEFPAEIFS